MNNEIAISNKELTTVLQSSLYPGAAENSVALVLSYCQAAKLDPMQKPVHIVPMWNKDQKRLVDVIMPGVGLYRIQAARTGQYAGITDAEFSGEDTKWGVTFPVSCKVTVKRKMDDGTIAEFTATERWLENYATKGKDSNEPNAMWSKRPYAQLAKCAEAQALRKAFPEVGSAPTADEMEGMEIESAPVIKDITPTQLPVINDAHLDNAIKKHGPLIQKGERTAAQLIAHLEKTNTLTDMQRLLIESLQSVTIEGGAE